MSTTWRSAVIYEVRALIFELAGTCWEHILCAIQTLEMRVREADLNDAERYFELLQDAKVKGYLFSQTNYISKDK